MYILTLMQNNDEIPLALFETIEDGRKAVQTIPGYKRVKETEGDESLIYETITVEALPDYMEIKYKGNRLPISRFMFKDNTTVEIIWRPIANMEKPNQGLVEGHTIVDAYTIANDEVQSYITKREQAYERIKRYLNERGYDTDRYFHGSQDGEAIVYKKKDETQWHMLTHLDPSFVDSVPLEETALAQWIMANL